MTNLLGAGTLHVSVSETNKIATALQPGATSGIPERVTAVEGYTNRAATAWQNPAASTNWTWTSDGTQITLTGYSGPAAVVIPDTLDNLPVTGIGLALSPGKQGSAIISVSGGANLLNLDESAFEDCANLVTVALSPRNIPALAFFNCSALKSASFPLCTNVGAFAFDSCAALVELDWGQNAMVEAPGGIYNGADNVTNYVTSSTATGWGATWNGRPVVRLPLYADALTVGGTNLATLLASKLGTNATPDSIGAISNNGVTINGITLGNGTNLTITGGGGSGGGLSNIVIAGVHGTLIGSGSNVEASVSLESLAGAGVATNGQVMRPAQYPLALTNTPTLQQVVTAGGNVTSGVVSIDDQNLRTNTYGGAWTMLGIAISDAGGAVTPGVSCVAFNGGNATAQGACSISSLEASAVCAFSFAGGIARNVYSFGHHALATNNYAWAWDGFSAGTYGSHGIGTFNVNPVGGVAGFWLGQTNLLTLLDAKLGTNATPDSIGAISNGGLRVNGVVWSNGTDVTINGGGSNGTNGLNAYVSVTNVVTLPAGAAAWVSNNIVGITNYLTLGIPQGPAGTNATGGIDAPTATNIVQGALSRFITTNSIEVTNSTTFSIDLPFSSICIDDMRVFATTPGTYSRAYSIEFFRSSDFRRTYLAYTYTNAQFYATTTTVAQAIGSTTNVVADASGIRWPIAMYWQSAGGTTNDYVSFTNATATTLWNCCTNTIDMPVGSQISYVGQFGSFNYWDATGGSKLYGRIKPNTGWTGTVQIVMDGARK
jgi:hypothetical protein